MGTKTTTAYSVGKLKQFYRDCIISAVTFVFFLGMLLMSFNIVALVSSDVGPAFFPRIIGIFGLLLSVTVFIGGLNKASRQKGAASGEKPVGEQRKELQDLAMVALSLVMLAVVAMSMQSVGFVPTTSVYALVQSWILTPDDKKGKKTLGIIAACSLVIPYLIFLLFTKVFYLMLPPGTLF